MKTVAHLLVAVWISLLSPALSAQTLWTKSEYGMTVDQVKHAFPEAVVPSHFDRLHGGATNLLVIHDIKIASQPFQANFYFLSEKLAQVTLSLENPGQFGTVMVTFKSVEEILRVKYGPEIQRDISTRTFNHAAETWLSGATNIGLHAMSVGDSKAILNIVYQVRLSEEAKKL